METYHLISAQDNATGEYRQVGYLNVGDIASRIMQIWLLAFIVAVMAFVFSFIARNLGKLPAGFRIGLPEAAMAFIVFLATIALQEWMHVLVLQWYGARPKFELFHNKAIAYISVVGYGLRRNTVIVAALTPLILLTLFSLLCIWLLQGSAWVALFALIAVVNAGAATSDVWVIILLLRYPSRAWIVDDTEGMRILMPM